MAESATQEVVAPRRRYHERLVEEDVIALAEYADGTLTASNADSSFSISRRLASHVAARLHARLGRTTASRPEEGFARITCDFLRESISTLAPQGILRAEFQLRDSAGPWPRAVFGNTGIAMAWSASPDAIRGFRTEPAGQGKVPERRVVVTAECLPARLACLALETPGLGCLYHFALPELFLAVEDYAREACEDLKGLLAELLIRGRIKDISALPEILFA